MKNPDVNSRPPSTYLSRHFLLRWLVLPSLLLLSLSSAHAQIVVNSTGDGSNGFPAGSSTCGTNPLDAVLECTLRAAFEVANGNPNVSTITFQIPTTDPGYNAQTKSYTINLGSALPDLSAPVKITGPGAAKLTVQPQSVAIRILNVTTSAAVNISGLTLAMGRPGQFEAGGGLQNVSSGTVTLSKCTLRDNAAGNGGAVANSSAGTLTINNSTLIDNESFSYGGAIYNLGELSVIGSTIRRNLAALNGGGVFNLGSASFTNTAVADNRVINQQGAIPADGGGIRSGGTLTLSNCTISGNSARGKDGEQNDPTTNYGEGGGIYSTDSVLTVVNCTISGNSAEGGSFFIASPAYGGGILFSGATLNLSNSTIAANSAISGYGSEGAPSSQGGGIYATAMTNVKSTIIANNSADSFPDASFTFISKGFNFIGKKDGSSGFTAATDLKGTIKLPLDPKLGVLQNNGGPTQTMALQIGSPAIDKGTSVGLTGTLTTDQRASGFPRKIDNLSVANATGGDGTDIGSFELGAP